MAKMKLVEIEERIVRAVKELRHQQALVLLNTARGRKADFARLLSHSLRQFRMLEIFRTTVHDENRFERDSRVVFRKECKTTPVSEDTRDVD